MWLTANPPPVLHRSTIVSPNALNRPKLHQAGGVMNEHPMKDPVSWLYPAIEPYRTGRL